MIMDKIWAPWRSGFIKLKTKKRCIFCVKKASLRDKYIIKKSKFSFALLNIYPYNNGHIMVSPYMHLFLVFNFMKPLLHGAQILSIIISPYFRLHLSICISPNLSYHL